jgi:hypothetical protein
MRISVPELFMAERSGTAQQQGDAQGRLRLGHSGAFALGPTVCDFSGLPCNLCLLPIELDLNKDHGGATSQTTVCNAGTAEAVCRAAKSKWRVKPGEGTVLTVRLPI